VKEGVHFENIVSEGRYKEITCEDVNHIQISSGECIVSIFCEHDNEPLSSVKGGQFSHRPLLHGVSYLGVSKNK
jgi:hypothetical protein